MRAAQHGVQPDSPPLRFGAPNDAPSRLVEFAKGFKNLLALYTNFRGGRCLTHIGTEGLAAVDYHVRLGHELIQMGCDRVGREVALGQCQVRCSRPIERAQTGQVARGEPFAPPARLTEQGAQRIPVTLARMIE